MSALSFIPCADYVIDGCRLTYVCMFTHRGIIRRFRDARGNVVDFTPADSHLLLKAEIAS